MVRKCVRGGQRLVERLAKHSVRSAGRHQAQVASRHQRTDPFGIDLVSRQAHAQAVLNRPEPISISKVAKYRERNDFQILVMDGSVSRSREPVEQAAQAYRNMHHGQQKPGPAMHEPNPYRLRLPAACTVSQLSGRTPARRHGRRCTAALHSRPSRMLTGQLIDRRVVCSPQNAALSAAKRCNRSSRPASLARRTADQVEM